MPWTTPKTWATGELVTAADLNTHLRDNLNFLLSPNFQEAVGSGTDFSTTSTTYADITGMSVTITTAGGNLLVSAFGRFTGSAGANAFLAINLDGTDYEVNTAATVSGSGLYVCALRRFVVSAGAHTVKLRLRTESGSYAASFVGGTSRRLLVVEGAM